MRVLGLLQSLRCLLQRRSGRQLLLRRRVLEGALWRLRLALRWRRLGLHRGLLLCLCPCLCLLQRLGLGLRRLFLFLCLCLCLRRLRLYFGPSPS